MSRSALSAQVFAVYLFLIGGLVIVAPNGVLSALQMPTTTDVWFRVVGVTAFMIGVFAWVGGRYRLRPFLVATVYTRCAVFVLFTTFVVLGLGPPMLVLFGVVDLLGGLWTHWALKADAGFSRRAPAPAH
ncbi:hypothetical protein HLB44_03230 [Aquincola sp. S2]|uniref:Uncharacterized protein n=1 Tax=Pseudaquabacterium terrae TaxID=2732868 RepID=A0ABX2EDA6_9BURK|nr:hypothetical protein [Aquabacterium terrae]NRF65995.1 hypothetical protein [Aquabacterium terrae]